MSFTKSETKKEADDIIKSIFAEVIKSDDKKLWKKALDSIESIMQKHSMAGEIRKSFVWRGVKSKMLRKYGNKFIKSNS